ncbi:cupin domain-containing protein [Mycetocola reblochoni]|uniref:DUF985 domain-containing protein n=2 Tax=Mycetocola reblochoni TaxID=331618 RepID=A0A1R4JKJ9_9MICO|nr:cupin domain-containing protein [Mycetocola reblochoni]RLP69205.1 cupin domain-containing protein [Mycetocola reblochoni]SJN32512.1 hypothetical protein FM119_08035 [Mycetocola reblochoni REB411]
MSAPDRAVELGLSAHPEGGWYRRLYTSTVPVGTAGGTRPTATAILFYLAQGEEAAWHRVVSDEVWLWHGPAALDVDLAGNGAAPEPSRVVRLAAPGTPGAQVQLLVPAGTWQRSRPVPGSVPVAGPGAPEDTGVLCSCVVSPGFSFDDWELAGDGGLDGGQDDAGPRPSHGG